MSFVKMFVLQNTVRIKITVSKNYGKKLREKYFGKIGIFGKINFGKIIEHEKIAGNYCFRKGTIRFIKLRKNNIKQGKTSIIIEILLVPIISSPMLQ